MQQPVTKAHQRVLVDGEDSHGDCQVFGTRTCTAANDTLIDTFFSDSACTVPLADNEPRVVPSASEAGRFGVDTYFSTCIPNLEHNMSFKFTCENGIILQEEFPNTLNCSEDSHQRNISMSEVSEVTLDLCFMAKVIRC